MVMVFVFSFSLAPGSCVLKYVDEIFSLYVVGWRGSSSLRAYVDTNDTIHILRLIGADLSKFGGFLRLLFLVFCVIFLFFQK